MESTHPKSDDEAILHTSPLLQSDGQYAQIVRRSSREHNSEVKQNKPYRMEEKTKEIKNPPMAMRYIYTFMLCYMLFVYGMQVAALGPAMVDMTYIYDVSMDMMTITTSLWSVGYCLGALTAFSFRWLNRQLVNVGLMTIGTILFALLPYAPSVYVAYVFQLFLGIGHGVLDTSQNVWLLEMWHENPNPVMQLSQAVYGVGTIVAPLIEAPFVTGDEDDGGNSTTKAKNSTQITPAERQENLMVPFILFGGLFLLGVVVLFLLFFIKRYVSPPREIIAKSRDAAEGADDTKLFERENAPKVWVIGLAALCLGTYVPTEISFFNYSATFAQKIALKVSAPDAAVIQSALAAAFTAGRLANFFIAMKLRPRQLLILHYSIIFISLVMLLFADQSIIILWIANITIGYGFAAMWASILTFMEELLVMSDAVGGLMVSCAGVFGAFVPYLIGLQIEEVPMSLIYIEFGLISFSCAMHVLMRFLVRYQESKLK